MNMRKAYSKPYKQHLYEEELKKLERLRAEKERYLSIPKYSLLDRCLTVGNNLTLTQNLNK